MNWRVPISTVRKIFSPSSYRVRGWLFSFLSGAVVVMVFIILQKLVPSSWPSYNEIVTVIFILLSVVLLFPARDALYRLALRRDDYEAMFGGGHHLDFIARQFTLESITNDIFPALMQWMGVRAAKLAIMESSRKHFVYYAYSDGQPIKSRSAYYQSIEQLLIYVRTHKAPLAAEQENPEEIQKILRRIRAAMFYPLLYNNRLVGFLIMHEEPSNKYTQRALETFSGKAAASIQNALLSARFMDSTQMDREFVVAEKIRRFLQKTDVPKLPGVDMTQHANDRSPVVIEFFRTPEQTRSETFAVLFGADRLNGSTAMLLSGMLGSLYSFIRKEKQINLHKLLTHFRKHRISEVLDHRVDVCLAEIHGDQRRIFLMVDGPGFQIKDVDQPDRVVTSTGWRNVIEMNDHRRLRIEFGSNPVLTISAHAIL